MMALKKCYIINEKGKKNEVVLSIKDYYRILHELEELESIKAYDAAKISNDEAIPFEQAINEIERERK